MGKVVFEFNEEEDSFDIRLVANRQKLMYARSEINDYIRELYKGYARGTVIVSGDKVLGKITDTIPEEYINKEQKVYVEDEEVMRKIESIIDPIRDLLNGYC